MRKIFGDSISKIWVEEELQLLKNAYEFAVVAHKDVMRKGTDIPYITHPVEAACIAMTMTGNVEVVVAALLHDVVEDTEYSLEDIKKKFGQKIADLVEEETENKREGMSSEETWRIRKEEAIARFATASYDAKIIALSDKLSNLRSMDRDYKTVGEKLWQRFHQKDKNEHGWYYKSMAEVTKDLSGTDAWKEYKALCETVFGEWE